MALELIAALSAAGLFAGMLLLSEIGRRIGLAGLRRHPGAPPKDGNAAEAAVFGLLGLLIAFTFSGAALRFHDRRQLIAAESNAIGTAYLRLDLLPKDARRELRTLVRRYTELRATVYQVAGDRGELTARFETGEGLQREIWAKAVAAVSDPQAPPPATMLLLPALNEMIDITTTREAASQTHPPAAIYGLLGGLCMVGALLVGHGTASGKNRHWFYPVMFAGIVATTIYVIVDVEYPRLGLIRVDNADQILLDLHKSMQ